MKQSLYFLVLLFSISFCIAQTDTTSEEAYTKLTIQDIRWSPDGEHILFSAMIGKSDWSDYKPNNWGLYEVHVPSKNIIKIADAALGGSYSSTRREIIYSSLVGGDWEIVLLNVSSGDTTILTDNMANDRTPSFSPDNRSILFTSDRDEAQEIYIMDHNGFDQKRITNTKGSKAYNPEWSPDGNSIVYYLEKGDGQDQVYVLNMGAPSPLNITRNTLNNIFPGWAGNTSIIYSAGGKQEKAKVFRIDSDGNNLKQIGDLESFYARYAPDGSSLAYIGAMQEGNTITVVNAAGVTPRHLLLPDVFIETFGVKR